MNLDGIGAACGLGVLGIWVSFVIGMSKRHYVRL